MNSHHPPENQTCRQLTNSADPNQFRDKAIAKKLGIATGGCVTGQIRH
jgi:hypothetical protein